MIVKFKLKPLPSHGDLYTIDEFIHLCKHEVVDNYAGTGYYSTSTGMSGIRAKPFSIKNGLVNKDFTHVVWFNK